MSLETTIAVDTKPQRGSDMLVAIVASYIDSLDRWKLFMQMINTVATQTESLDAVYIGISFPSKDMQQIYESRLHMVRDLLSNVCSRLTITQTRARCSQGKMWQRMARRYPALSDPSTWLLFSDDDDLWHKDRVAMYLHGLQMVRQHPPSQRMLVSNIRSNVCATSDRETRDVKMEDVDVLLESGELHLGSQLNYWDLCIRGTIFCEFMSIANDFILQDPTFDVLLRAYICKYNSPNGRCIIMKPAAGVWMYFWRKHDGVCSALQKKYELKQCSRERLRYAVERQMMASLDNIEDTIEACISKWVVGANPFRVRYDARRFGRNFPVELQRKIGMFNRDPSRMFMDKIMAGLDEIDLLDELPNVVKNLNDSLGLKKFVDESLLDACGHDMHAYQAVRDGMNAILHGETVDNRCLPQRARTFMQAFEVA